MKTVREAFTEAKMLLEKAAVEDAAFEVTVLMEDLLGLPKQPSLSTPETVLGEEQLAVLKKAVEKRCEHYPLQYIVGNWEFYGRRFAVGEGVLIPRQETELLCECVLHYFKKRQPPRIVDLCSGSGCVAITLSEEIPGSAVTAVELYDGACRYLRKNAESYGNKVTVVEGDALVPFGEFDCVTANPPYVAETERSSLQKELSFEPETSIFGGEDGLMLYRGIAENWYSHLTDGGLIAFEIDNTQGRAVETILKESGYYGVSVWEDYAGLDRIVTGMK